MKRNAITIGLAAALALLIAVPAQAQSFDGRYDGKLTLAGGDNCGEAAEFWAEVKGNSIRVYSPRAQRAFDGVINSSGRFIVGGMIATASDRLTLEWNGQIGTEDRSLGTLTLRGNAVCQFLFSLQKN